MFFLYHIMGKHRHIYLVFINRPGTMRTEIPNGSPLNTLLAQEKATAHFLEFTLDEMPERMYHI